MLLSEHTRIRPPADLVDGGVVFVALGAPIPPNQCFIKFVTDRVVLKAKLKAAASPDTSDRGRPDGEASNEAAAEEADASNTVAKLGDGNETAAPTPDAGGQCVSRVMLSLLALHTWP